MLPINQYFKVKQMDLQHGVSLIQSSVTRRESTWHDASLDTAV